MCYFCSNPNVKIQTWPTTGPMIHKNKINFEADHCKRLKLRACLKLL